MKSRRRTESLKKLALKKLTFFSSIKILFSFVFSLSEPLRKKAMQLRASHDFQKLNHLKLCCRYVHLIQPKPQIDINLPQLNHLAHLVMVMLPIKKGLALFCEVNRVYSLNETCNIFELTLADQ